MELKEILVDEVVGQGYGLGGLGHPGFPASKEQVMSFSSGGIELLFRDPRDLPQRKFFGLITKPAPRRVLGTIWFENQQRSATEDSWVIEAHGRDNLKQVGSLADDLSGKFAVKVAVKLVREDVHYELRRSDFDY
jgi:hypothetical protein